MNGCTMIRSANCSAKDCGSIAGSTPSVIVDNESSVGSAVSSHTAAATTHSHTSFHRSAHTPMNSSTPYAARMSPTYSNIACTNPSTTSTRLRRHNNFRIGHHSRPASRCRRTICATPYPNNTPNIGNARPSTNVEITTPTRDPPATHPSETRRTHARPPQNNASSPTR